MDDSCWIVDRFEGTVAIIEREDGSWMQLPRDRLPPETKPGDVLRVYERDGVSQLKRDPEATRAREIRMRAQLQRLAKRDPGGDLEL